MDWILIEAAISVANLSSRVESGRTITSDAANSAGGSWRRQGGVVKVNTAYCVFEPPGELLLRRARPFALLPAV